jgi:hypothetical protein
MCVNICLIVVWSFILLYLVARKFLLFDLQLRKNNQLPNVTVHTFLQITFFKSQPICFYQLVQSDRLNTRT